VSYKPRLPRTTVYRVEWPDGSVTLVRAHCKSYAIHLCWKAGMGPVNPRWVHVQQNMLVHFEPHAIQDGDRVRLGWASNLMGDDTQDELPNLQEVIARKRSHTGPVPVLENVAMRRVYEIPPPVVGGRQKFWVLGPPTEHEAQVVEVHANWIRMMLDDGTTVDLGMGKDRLWFSRDKRAWIERQRVVPKAGELFYPVWRMPEQGWHEHWGTVVDTLSGLSFDADLEIGREVRRVRILRRTLHDKYGWVRWDPHFG